MAFPLSPDLLVELALAPGVGAPARARQAVRQALEGRVSDEVLLDAQILASEMVSHRVRHGALGSVQAIRLLVRLGRAIVIAVDDTGLPVRPEVLIDRNSEQSGFLRVVERLASRWGAGGGYRPTLWAELDPDPIG